MSKNTHIVPNKETSFAQYIEECKLLIKDRRLDLKQPDQALKEKIINANLPFELLPLNNTSSKPHQNGVLFLHGLLDSPFSMREIAEQLQNKDILSRSVLLPGHGTQADDLQHVSWQDWVKTSEYGINGMKEKVDRLFLVGYSTGAALSIYHALHHNDIAGIILISPAIKLKIPVNIMIQWRHVRNWIAKTKPWVTKSKENDYAKYKSIPFNAVSQVQQLINQINKHKKNQLKCPIFTIMSEQDETVSAHAAISFFKHIENENNRFLLYTDKTDASFQDDRMLVRSSSYPELSIKNFSHTCIPFSATNPHYGLNGDFHDKAHSEIKKEVYGAFNRIESDVAEVLNHHGLLSTTRNELTYNPDFEFFCNELQAFIKGNT